MVKGAGRYLVIQTAFLGDVILTLPMIQLLKQHRPEAIVDIVVVPGTADALRGHPAVSRVIPFDKRGTDRGIAGLLRLASTVRSGRYDVAMIPHRSLRSALIARLGRIPVRIGFRTSSGRFLLTSKIDYHQEWHEISRNMELLEGIGISGDRPGRKKGKTRVPPPRLYPSVTEKDAVDRFLDGAGGTGAKRDIVCLAPGTVWNTKRWMGERFAELARRLSDDGVTVVLVGGPRDAGLCAGIASAAGRASVMDASGRLSILESAELVGRARALVCNDSAPLHVAGAMDTPVVAVFGATVPGFGFGPIGPRDLVVETAGLSCRPCSIHGGNACPVGTFDCMERISVDMVHDAVRRVLAESPS